MDEKELAYAYFLHNACERNNKVINRLLQELGTAENIYYMEEKILKGILNEKQVEKFVMIRKNWSVFDAYERLAKQGIQFYTSSCERYPEKLKTIPDTPYGIYVKGTLPEETVPTIAIIGARNCSEYGRMVARECGRNFAKLGVQVVSGMARGIDGISQQAAVTAGGKTFAVLGSGVDVCYPETNRELYNRIQECGGIISEYRPSMAPIPRNFPPRNRIISGLSDAVLVIEAKEKSGTLITVDMALEQGKEIFVIPGRVTDALSYGCNRLIKQGAGIVLSMEELLDDLMEIWHMYKNEKKVDTIYTKQMEMKELTVAKVQDPLAKTIIECLDVMPKSLEGLLDELTKRNVECGENGEINLPNIMQRLVDLQIRGIIQQTAGQYNLCISI